MTLMQRIRRAGQELEPGWDERDVDRVWQGLKRKRRRRTIAAGAGVAVAATAGVVVWAVLGASGRDVIVAPAGQSVPAGRSAPQSAQDGTLRFADGSTAVPWGGPIGSLAVVEDSAERVVVALARGGARFEVVPRPERVFSVQAGEVTVTVLGTTFSVERVADRVGVTVGRGAVRVDWGVDSRRLAAGDDGWFPPLVVSPPAGDKDAEVTPKEARPVRPPRQIGRPPSPSVEPTAPDAGAAVVEAPSAAKLMADADRARLVGRFEEGASLLERLVREHPGDPRAPLAAFSLGRLLLGELHRPADAARAFARARALAPDGPLADDALAREAEAWARAGEPERARAREAEQRARTRTDGGQRP
jgi:transmembrane sensor